MEIIVPPVNTDENGDIAPWPTLGPQVVDFIERKFTYGPGPLKGQPYIVRDEFRYLVYRMYEHYPEDFVIDYDGELVEKSGRRRFNRVILSLPKGSSKCVAPDTEFTLRSGVRLRADELEAGQEIMSYLDGKVVYRKVAGVEEQPKALTYRVTTDHGRVIEVSEGHPFLVSGTQWVSVEKLQPGDLLTAIKHGQPLPDRVHIVEEIGETVTIGVEVEDTHVHVTNGLVTHNTEFMSIISLTELHPDAPVRFNGYDDEAEGGLAPGRAVLSPFIPLIAPNLEQVSELAYGVASEIVREIDDASLFDPTQARILINGEADSMIKPVSASAGRLDGGKPTFQGVDETHRFIEDRHIKAFDTMMNNLPKRLADDPWQLSTTTAGDPSEASVALAEYRHGIKIFEGKIQEPNTLFYHRQTSDENAKFDTMGQRLRALKEASGEDAAKFRDLVSVAAMWDDENNDHSYLERVWCNRWVQSSTSAFDAKKFRALGDPTLKILNGSRVTLGMDGALNNDSTAIVATDIDTGIQNVIGLWERPDDAKKWTVPIGEVYEVVADAFRSFDVEAFYADPPYWQQALADWSQLYGDKVIEWPTRNELKNYYAIRAYAEAISLGEVGHDGQKEFEDHIANAGKNFSNRVDDEGNRRYVLAKRNRDKKIDICVAAYLSWQARLDVISGSDVDESEEYYTIPQKVR